jgi:hypothetical protein
MIAIWAIGLAITPTVLFLAFPAPGADTQHPDIPTPAWLKDEPLIITGNWDSMPIFRRQHDRA